MHNSEFIARLYRSLFLIRKTEERIADVYSTDVIKSPVHLSIGQEAIAVGVCDAMLKDDLVSNTYRCHATYMAKGGDYNAMMAELYGKRDGCAGGKAGSMHLIDIQNGVLGASAVVGTTIPVAAGYALALQREAKKTGKQRVVVAFLGDGATEEGCFHETINFAALHKLPILFICENNRLAIYTKIEKRWATELLCERVATYGIRTHKITDNDIFKIHDLTSQEIARIRAGEGPVFIECNTYRWRDHVGPSEDLNEPYRNSAEIKFWREHDQVSRLAAMLENSLREKIEKEVMQQIADAEKYAEQSSFPGITELYQHVYA